MKATEEGLARFHPVLREWFARTFGDPTDVQLRAWKEIEAGKHTLIAAPTGSGKTLAALLPCLNRIASAGGKPKKGVRVLYITPLKALNNDVHHHVLGFVDDLAEVAERMELPWHGIRSAVRTGDTTSSQRASMLRNPPDILVTTPESLYLLLTSEKGRAILKTVEQLIVDEIHELASDKRGAHLALSIERLAEWTERPIQRIGVSATQKPLERVARFLGGWKEQTDAAASGAAMVDDSVEPANSEDIHPLGFSPREVAIVESAMEKKLELLVTMPDQNQPVQSREGVWLPLLNRLMELMGGCRSVLLFVNSRRICERLCLRLNDHVGYEMARSHHGSMSRERRLEVEQLLKDGALRCLVATSSLELGIDVGHVDLVIQIDSPLEAARGIQRIGRAGHAVGQASRGVILSRQRGLLPEIAVLSRLISDREIEEIRLPRSPIDVLSQQLVGMVVLEDRSLRDIHRLLVRSESYRSLAYERLEEIIQVLSGTYPFVRPLLDWDPESGRVSGRSNSAMASVTGVGTIPSTGNYPVHHLDSRVHLGELDEEFITESRVGDVFQLGTSSWMIREIKQDRVYVSEAGNRFSEVPFWRAEAGGRSFELGLKIGAFVQELADRLGSPNDDGEYSKERKERSCGWLADQYSMDGESAEALVALIASQRDFCALPTDRRIVIEYYKDVMNQTHVVLHNYFGRQVNRAWLLAIERQLEQLLPYRLYGNAKDNGIEFVLPEWDPSWIQAIRQVSADHLEKLLTEAITGSPLLGLAFRRIAETSLLLSRSFTRTPLWQKRLRGEELLRAVMPYAERFPYLREAMRESLFDYLDTENLKRVLEAIRSQDMEFIVKETPHPSAFASQFLADYVNMRIYEGEGLDDAIKLQLLNVSKELAGQVFGQEQLSGAIPPSIVEAERRRIEETDAVKDADSLYRLLKQSGDKTADELLKKTNDAQVLAWLEELKNRGRAKEIDLTEDGELRWICADEEAIYAGFPESADSRVFILDRYAEQVLSFTELELCERYPSLTLKQAEIAVQDMLRREVVERSPHAAHSEERIWTSSKLAARMVRLSMSEARGQAQAAEAASWCAQIVSMQSLRQGTRKEGTHGLLQVIEKLQGLFAPLSQWESLLLPARMVRYRKEELDQLCSGGEIIWIGKKEEDDKEGKIAFFLADSKALYSPFLAQEDKPTSHPKLLERLQTGGASFLTRLAREEDKLPSEMLDELLDLVWEGRVSNDQFAPMRLAALPAKSRKTAAARAGSGFGRWYWTGELAERNEHPGAGSSSSNLSGGAKDSKEASAVHWAHHLLQSYGLVNKELVAKTTPFEWDSFYPVMKRLEEWGAVTRGVYIKGDSTLQFTTKELAESVRGLESQEPAADEEFTVVSAADPANPYGLFMEWPETANRVLFSRKPGNFLLLRGGRWEYWIENNGRRVYSLFQEGGSDLPSSNEAARLKSALLAILRQQGLVKLVIEAWNGREAGSSEAGERLLQIGAELDRKSLVFWAN
ncbi:DEAD/DEAH box helicase [Cohnella thailandensis]|uniref:DEAD/DEAH box helicase n=1 Tax=Cohnella thailandensis TaxID=557557 RepID=A0A841T195_9BACL|nr:DEAD/DEAH box helicase [Cohnella thailandensis]MBB6636829.1 DEAD/DEAH box helicase [Cohnella thailandensis]MBP1973294.1 ATP-dependent Lhr-like helicase [Cohnella thailandensis]